MSRKWPKFDGSKDTLWSQNMSELFRSALGLLGGGQGDRGSDFVGSQVELGEMKLRVKRVIAEGGLVYFCWSLDRHRSEVGYLYYYNTFDVQYSNVNQFDIQFCTWPYGENELTLQTNTNIDFQVARPHNKAGQWLGLGADRGRPKAKPKTRSGTSWVMVSLTGSMYRV